MRAKQIFGLLLATALLALTGCASGARPAAQAPGSSAYLESQLSALDKLAAPKGVSAATWAELKSALRTTITARLKNDSSKQTLAAPVSSAAATRLTYDLDLGLFIWDYQCPGDYDQNGEVNISDLTPLAVHLGEAVPATADGPHTVQSAIDGDGNGLITIADLTPLGASLGRRVTEYRLYAYTGALPDAYPAGNAAASTITPLTSVPQTASVGDHTTQRVRYFASLSPLTPGTFYWVRPADATDGSEGTPSSTVNPDSGFPVAALNATPFSGSVPLPVMLDASASTGPGLNFYWDPEGTSVFVGTGASSSIAHDYTVNGTYTAFVRVENQWGLARTATVGINAGAAPQWRRYALPPAVFAPNNRSKAIACGMDNGVPYVLTSFHSDAAFADFISYYIAQGSTGSVWGPENNIASNFGDYVVHLETQPINGVPAFVRALDQFIEYSRADSSPLPRVVNATKSPKVGATVMGPHHALPNSFWPSMKRTSPATGS